MTTPPRVPLKRPGGRTARTGAAVTAATLEILSEEGFGALTVDAVAQRAEVHPTTVYRRWGSRERLVAEALAAQSAAEITIPDTGGVRGDLEAVAQMVAANLASPLGRALAQTMVGHGDDPDISRITGEFWSSRFDRTTVVVDRAIERGELPDHTDPRFLVEMVAAAIWFCSIATRGTVEDRFVRSVVDLVLAGAGAGAGGGAGSGGRCGPAGSPV